MPKPSLEILEKFKSSLHDEFIARLVDYADRKIQRLYWKGLRGGSLPEGAEALDIVQSTLEKVLNGDRNWDPEKHSHLFVWLKSQIRSEISNRVNSSENRRERLEHTLADSGFEFADPETPEMVLVFCLVE